jgi:hypothetical protein
MILVTREHINGNTTHASFLVDLYCLGVKECYWMFNQHPLEFREFMENQAGVNEFGIRNVKTNYSLVHNIIYGAAAFAEEFGFKPHKSFDLAQHILEEDTDRVKLIDIEFGYKGKPLYVSGPENQPEEARVKAHLAKTVGEGNYYYITEAEADDFFDQEDDDENERKIYQDPEVKIGLIREFISLSESPKKMLSKSLDKLADIIEKAEVIFYEYMVSDDELKGASDSIDKLLDFNITAQVLSDDLIFGKTTLVENRVFLRKEAERLMTLASEGKIAQGRPEVEKLIGEYPDMPVFKYLLLRFMESKTQVGKLKSTFKYYQDMFPDYLPFTYLYLNACIIDKGPKTERKMPEHLHLKNYYPGKTDFCIDEVLQYVHLLILYYGISGELIKLQLLIAQLEANHPGLLPFADIVTARILIVPRVVDWCNEYLKG